MFLNQTRIRSLVAGVLMISDVIDPMGSNKTSLLLVMAILILGKSVKLDVIGMRSSVASLS